MGDPDRWGAFNAHFQNLCDRAHVRPEVIQTAPESRAILGLVACGLGLTVMPESFAATLDARLAALPIRGMEEPMTTLAVWRRAAAHPALIRFVEHMEAATAVR